MIKLPRHVYLPNSEASVSSDGKIPGFSKFLFLCLTTRCFCEAYTGLPVVSATENQKALNCVVLKYSIPVSEE